MLRRAITTQGKEKVNAAKFQLTHLRTVSSDLYPHLQSFTARDRCGVKSAIVLLPLLGITWIFGVLTFNSETVAFQYLFATFNSLQVNF